MGGLRPRQGRRRVCASLPVRMLKAQRTKLSALSLPEGWEGVASTCFSGGDLSFSQKQKLQHLGYCRYLALCVVEKPVLLQLLAPHLFCVQNPEELSCMHCIFDVLVHAKPDERMYS